MLYKAVEWFVARVKQHMNAQSAVTTTLQIHGFATQTKGLHDLQPILPPYATTIKLRSF